MTLKHESAFFWDNSSERKQEDVVMSRLSCSDHSAEP